MAHFLLALKTVAPLFLVIFSGTLFSRTKAAHGPWIDVLNKYALWIGFPALVVASLMHLDPRGESYTQLILINSTYIAVCMLLAFPIARIFKLSKRLRSSLFLILSFGNVAYLGIPVLRSSFGEAILPVAAVLSAVYVFWLLTLGVILIEATGEESIQPKKLMLSLVKNPLLLSVFVGVAIVLFQIKVPSFIDKTVSLFAESVTAVVLFSLGIFLGQNKIGAPREWIRVFIFIVLTMIALPVLLYFGIKTTGLNDLQFKATILDSAMPLGLTPYALAVQYKLETKLVARIVVLGTLLSVLIIPFWIAFLG
ncbi:AEC family transporter [uncultured Draconibacterium sp.]|uniref:AEC family transporter n=1 Tax=uncultured Draconibacterium sp. TaxID=1573823 RepID=UPI002AA7DD2E|nr:AEC family transporter [uncultured Draconibacterium sp.]